MTAPTLTKDTTFEEWLRAENAAGRAKLAWATDTQDEWEKFKASFDTPALAPFTGIIEVGTDDDFHLEIAGKTIHHNGVDYTPKCNTLEECMAEVAKIVQSTKVVWSKKWSMTSEKESKSGDYADHWVWLADEALKAMTVGSEWHEDYKLFSDMPEFGVPNFSKGGNQTLEISFHRI